MSELENICRTCHKMLRLSHTTTTTNPRHDEAHWVAIGYVPGPKVPKVTLALRNNELKVLSLFPSVAAT